MGGRRIGEICYEAEGPEPLPILVKWLFTSEKLSIQVHPNDIQAQARGMPSGKEECWYIVDAEPDAVLGMGTKTPLDAEALRTASLSGEIEQLMDWKPVKPGDYFYIPAGTVHAIGAGITLVEVQQYADITYRLYDYGRPRELHLEDGFRCPSPLLMMIREPVMLLAGSKLSTVRTLICGWSAIICKLRNCPGSTAIGESRFQGKYRSRVKRQL
jgi:mannose-6-phosphate isomerase